MSPMRPLSGQAATGPDFFDRPREIRNIWEALDTGAHLLIAAPRRVGKTSILFRLQDLPRQGYICLYVITQSADSQRDFFKRLYHVLLDDPRVRERISAAYKVGKSFKEVLDRLKGVKVGPAGIDFQDASDVDYYDEFKRLSRSLPDDLPRIVLMVDEFPDALLNIERIHNRNAAIAFLQTCRELRQDPEIKAKLQFIYTGSVGLENVVTRLGVPEHINDLQRIEISQLSAVDARQFIANMEKPFTLDAATTEALIAKVGWCIPYHLSVVLYEMRVLWEDGSPAPVDAALIDRAFNRLIRNRTEFQFWQTRLKERLDQPSYEFAEKLLSELSLAPNGVIGRDRIRALAAEQGFDEERRRYVQRVLIHDGYINDDDEPHRYRFNSPLLRLWWQHNIADF